MLRMDDDSIERFFKKADDSRFNVEYDENDWKNMERMLDEKENSLSLSKNRRLTYTAIAATLLLLLCVSAYLFIRNNPDSVVELSGDLSKVSSANASDSSKNDADLNAKKVQDSNELSVQPKEDEGLKNNNGAVNKLPKAIAIDTNGNSTPDSKTISKKIYSSGATQGESGSVMSDKNGLATLGVGEDPRGEKIDETLITSDEQNSTTEGNRLNDSKLNETNIPTFDADMKAGDVLTKTEDTALAGNIEEKKTDAIRSKWMISLTIAPDFSRTTSSDYDSPGDAFGVFIHYQFMKRWSLSTGIMRSDKQYWGYGDEYHPPTGYWNYVTNGIVPETVEGNCLVLEVPLALTFNVVETNRSRVFATAGVSSYFMRSEDYTYTFEDPNPGSGTGWSTDEPSSYWFGIGSLSVGYDYRVSPTLSFGVEPYYKIPFCGVGWANIDLYSMGVLFNARYRFLKKEH